MRGQDIQRDLFRLVDRISHEIESFTDGLSDIEKNAAGSLEEWAPRDVITHLVFWQEHFNNKLSNARSGKKAPSAGDYLDQVNDGVFIQHAGQTFSDAKRELNAALKRSRQLLQEETDEELTAPGRYEYLGERTLLYDALGTIGWHIPFHLSDYTIKTGKKQAAIDLQEGITTELSVFPGWEVNAVYNLACFFAQNNEPEKALENLRAAFKQKPDLREWAKQDSDLDSLQEHPEFKSLMQES